MNVFNMVSYFPWAVTKAYWADSGGGSETESLNMQSALKARLRIGTLSLPPCSIGQSKSHGQSRWKERGNRLPALMGEAAKSQCHVRGCSMADNWVINAIHLPQGLVAITLDQIPYAAISENNFIFNHLTLI